MYKPNQKLLKKYADVLVKFALNSGLGVKKGEVVQVIIPDIAKPMLLPLQESLLESGAQPLIRFLATGIDKQFYQLANDEQLTFFPKEYLKTRVKLIDHSIGIIAEHNPHELKSIDPKKIMLSVDSKKQVRQWLDKKEYAGKFTWTLALYGTRAMAKEANLSLDNYWLQIIKACFLDYPSPITKWRAVIKEQQRVIKILNSLSIEKLQIKAKGINLWITMGEKRKWVGGRGRNIPCFEIFTSPDWRETEGEIAFNQPLYRYGNLIEGIKLEFKKGKVIRAAAKRGEALLHEMLKRKNADKIGEFSMTDGRVSRITKFMANTLFDENMGGKFGNTHIALGMSYKDTYDGDPRKVKKSKWQELGFNDSGEHCDIISTENRTIHAYLRGGEKRIIYQDGKFLV